MKATEVWTELLLQSIRTHLDLIETLDILDGLHHPVISQEESMGRWLTQKIKVNTAILEAYKLLKKMGVVIPKEITDYIKQ